MIDEGPSSEDIERFDRDTAFCPDCGAEVWDEADVCPKCFSYIGGQTTTQPPLERTISRKSIVVVVVLVLIAFGMVWLMSGPAGR